MLKKSNTAKRKKKSWNFVLKLFWVSLFVYVWFFFFVLFFYVLWSRVVAVMAVEATVGGTNPGEWLVRFPDCSDSIVFDY